MRKFTVFLLFVFAFGCSKDDDPKVYTSVLGNWVLVTPDNATVVHFTISLNSDQQYFIDHSSVSQNGGNYTKESIDTEIVATSSTEFDHITFRTTDFVIRFLDLTVNDKFTELTVTNSSIIIGTDIRNFSMMKATRE
jgi:hypothetical protein